jgi:hypothetical protein
VAEQKDYLAEKIEVGKVTTPPRLSEETLAACASKLEIARKR